MKFTLLLATAVNGLRIEAGTHTALATITVIPRNDSRVPYPKGLDYTRLFCHDQDGVSTPPSVSSFFADRAVSLVQADAATCTTDSECSSSSPFCRGGKCRECRTSSDCADITMFCSASTEFSCSVCRSDDDCTTGQLCRKDSTSNRKRCYACTSVPANVLMKGPSTCDWTCPSGQAVGSDGQCTACPVCADGQMLIPSEDFPRSEPTSFFPQCAQSSNPKCVACPGTDNQCATQLSPTTDWSNQPDIGQLAPQFPCGTFRCNPGWYLDRLLMQCRKCDFRACGAGKMMANCGGAYPGSCVDCPPPAVDASLIPFIDPRDSTYTVNTALDVCKPQCPAGTWLYQQSPSSQFVCASCPGNESCPAGYFLTGCEGDSHGRCSPCGRQPLLGTYYVANGGCDVESCQPGACKAGTVLTGCGGDSAGSCSACPNPLPANAVGYASVYDDVTMVKDTCGVTCAAGFYVQRLPVDSVDKFACVPCDTASCPVGKKLTGCGKDQPGKCTDCAPVPLGRYFLPPPSAVCETARCPTDSGITCKPGEQLTGCGGTSAGNCTSCGSLPPGAASWDTACDITCLPNHYAQTTLGVRSCSSCSLLARDCAVGQTLTGCNVDSPGSCVACPSIDSDTFWTGAANCTTDACANRHCPDGHYARHCGLSNPGDCTSCGDLPVNGVRWSVVQNLCQIVCSDGYYATAAGQCIRCNLAQCADGSVLTQCSGTQAGVCAPCTNPASGLCFTSHGLTLDDRSSCSVAQCPVANI